MVIIIVGNGFDLAHDLKTNYTDFLQYIKDYQDNPDICDSKEFGTEIDIILKEKNIWLDFFQYLLQKSEKKESTWIDFETHLYNILMFFIDKENYVGGSTNDYFILNFKQMLNNNNLYVQFFKLITIKYSNLYIIDDHSLDKYIVCKENVDKILELLYKELISFANLLNSYYSIIINSNSNSLDKYYFNVMLIEQPLEGSFTPVLVFNFNYTNTFYKFYNDQCQHISFYYGYIHGKADFEPMTDILKIQTTPINIVLGTQKFKKLNNFDEQRRRLITKFEKFSQLHAYGDIDLYQKTILSLLLSLENGQKNKIYVIGHSLEESDHTMLKKIFIADPKAEIVIFFHSEDAQHRYIYNIRKILGEQDVNNRVKCIYQHDFNGGILIPRLRYCESSADSGDLYLIKDGENFDSICQRFGLSLSELRKLNGIEENFRPKLKIQAGRSFKIKK